MPEEAGPQVVSGRLPVEAGPAHHQVPAHAEGDRHVVLDHFHIFFFVSIKCTVGNILSMGQTLTIRCNRKSHYIFISPEMKEEKSLVMVICDSFAVVFSAIVTL